MLAPIAIVAPTASYGFGWGMISTTCPIRVDPGLHAHAAAWRSNAAGLICPSVECRRFWL